MFTKAKCFLGTFTPYQIGYLAVVLGITVCFILFFPELMLEGTSSRFVTACSIIAVLANPVCELFISKQSKQGRAMTVAPDDACGVNALRRTRDSLYRLYQKGYKDGQKITDYLKS